METAKMIHMANEIARFWEPYPHDEALAAVADHLRKFWEPRFRRQLVEYASSDGDGLHALVKEAAVVVA